MSCARFLALRTRITTGVPLIDDGYDHWIVRMIQSKPGRPLYGVSLLLDAQRDGSELQPQPSTFA
jgi:hypothetical protein